MLEDYDKKEDKGNIKEILFPILLSIIGFVFGFLLIQATSGINELNEKMDLYMSYSIGNTETNKHQDFRLNSIESRVMSLEDRNKSRDEWVQNWIEEWQGTLSWAKKKSGNND